MDCSGNSTGHSPWNDIHTFLGIGRNSPAMKQLGVAAVLCCKLLTSCNVRTFVQNMIRSWAVPYATQWHVSCQQSESF